MKEDHDDLVSLDKITDTKEEAELLNDLVNHPSHYTVGGIECIDYLEAKLTYEEFCGFLRGNVIKYMSRARHKDNTDALQDYRKALWYQDRLIATMEEADESDVD